ncbi:MAG: hypothetical protein HQM14_17810 [SAR324 cluster bacterium]|nr:hypothetical protein [SAR324 cluster bacterium]
MVYRISFCFFLFLILILDACSEEGPCPGLDPFCNRDAEAKVEISPGKYVNMGQRVELDASKSVFNDIDWYLDGQPIGECNGSETCFLTMNDEGVFVIKIRVKVNGYGFNPSSDDDKKITITVAKSCPLGQSAHDGIAISTSTNAKCLVMETSDRGECRSDSSPAYTNCKLWSEASTLCPGGTKSGDEWYLPSKDELKIVFDYVSGNKFCHANTNSCSSDPSSLDVSNPPATTPYEIPYAYWSQTASSTSYQHIALNFDTGSTFDGYDEDAKLSVRCVKWVD